eukprot:353133-Chlamydomonas_euryale.AAC.8
MDVSARRVDFERVDQLPAYRSPTSTDRLSRTPRIVCSHTAAMPRWAATAVAAVAVTAAGSAGNALMKNVNGQPLQPQLRVEQQPAALLAKLEPQPASAARRHDNKLQRSCARTLSRTETVGAPLNAKIATDGSIPR